MSSRRWGPTWKKIERDPEDAFVVDIRSYHSFRIIRRVKRDWWRRLLWAPWRKYRLEEPETVPTPRMEIRKNGEE